MSINSYQMPCRSPWWRSAARAIPWLEVALGLMLMAGIWLRISGTVLSLLLLTFFTLMVRAYAKGMQINCGCFGPGEVISWKTLLRDGSMAAAAIAMTWLAFLQRSQDSGVTMSAAPDDVFARELAYHEKLYSGFAQAHFARPAVRALRAHMAQRILEATGAGRDSRVLSLGCGIGDTELLLAPHVREIVGVDLSPAAIRQARADAARSAFATPASKRAAAPRTVRRRHRHLLPASSARCRTRRAARQAGSDPRARRLILFARPQPCAAFRRRGKKLIPHLMKKYQTPDERELDSESAAAIFRRVGFDVRVEMYDFGSSPLAGLFPGWSVGYHVARRLDDALLRAPALRKRGSNFELWGRLL